MWSKKSRQHSQRIYYKENRRAWKWKSSRRLRHLMWRRRTRESEWTPTTSLRTWLSPTALVTWSRRFWTTNRRSDRPLTISCATSGSTIQAPSHVCCQPRLWPAHPRAPTSGNSFPQTRAKWDRTRWVLEAQLRLPPCGVVTKWVLAWPATAPQPQASASPEQPQQECSQQHPSGSVSFSPCLREGITWCRCLRLI